MGQSVQADSELEAFKAAHRYDHVKRIPGGFIVAISPLTLVGRDSTSELCM